MDPRYIDANKIEYFALSGYGLTNKQFALKPQIDEIPTADVEPVIHAYWVCRRWDHMNDYYDVMEYPYRCSACRVKNKELTKRCPECGAHMD